MIRVFTQRLPHFTFQNSKRTMFNVSATLNVSRLAYNPSLCLPHITAKTFNDLSLPFKIPGHDDVTIKGVVLDKDNCFAKDKDDRVWGAYTVCLDEFVLR